jgi:hypothetical protein
MKKITLFLAAFTLLFFAQTMKAQEFTGGDGTVDNPFQISDPISLRALDNYVGTAGVGIHFALTADIDLAGEPWVPIATNTADVASAATPDDATNAIIFRGKLHGNGHKIKNLRVNNSDAGGKAWLLGLFGHVGEGALIEDVHIEGTNDLLSAPTRLAAYQRVASLIGRIYLGEDAAGDILIKNCSNTTPVTNYQKSSTPGNITGGLIGEITSASASRTVEIASCYNVGNMRGGHSVGGLVGYVTGYAEIHDSYFNGEIDRNLFDGTGMNGQDFHGGLVGQFNSNGNITNCYAAGIINNERPAESTVTSAHFSGGITGRVNVGGGFISGSVALQSAISTNVATTNTHRIKGGGGDATATPPTTCSLTNNYANSDMVFKDNGVIVNKTGSATNNEGANVTPATAKTQAFYAGLGWNFTDIWTIEEGVSYPTLKATGATGINAPKVDDPIIEGLTKYYNLQGVEVSKEAPGVKIVKNIHTSGAVSATKELKIK